jgi:branched-chain amino acid aminotransferase
MPIVAGKHIWFNGKLVPWEEATVHVLAHVIHYGSSVFEGMRCYKTRSGPAIFRLDDHLRRLLGSARIYRMPIPYTQEQLVEACEDAVASNDFEACYLRPVAYRGYGEMGVNPLKNPVEVAVAAWEWGSYLGAKAMEEGVDVQVSSWTRIAPNTLPALAKTSANYANSQLIKMEALSNGFAEGIALDTQGYVSEGSGENLFLVRDGRLLTPRVGDSILPGITRISILQLARDLGIEHTEGRVPREALYLCDEAFFAGTAAEVTPIRSIDRIPVGPGRPGEVTRKLEAAFRAIVTGDDPDRHGWLHAVRGARVDSPGARS